MAAPGAQEDYFRAKNADSMFEKTDKAPPITLEKDASGRVKPIRSIPAFFEPEPRLVLMDELGIDRSMMWPTLASLLEERLGDRAGGDTRGHPRPEPLDARDLELRLRGAHLRHADHHASVVDRALAELDWVLERGARAILVRPAPVPGYNGLKRPFALPEFDPFWRRVEEADVLVGMHASDSGYQKYTNEWEGRPPDCVMLPFERNPNQFAFASLREGPSPVVDAVASIIGHQLAYRFPRLKFAPVENGSGCGASLLERMAKAYERSPELVPRRPRPRCSSGTSSSIPSTRRTRSAWCTCWETDNVLFGSDYPHPEGLADPISFVDQLDGLPGPSVAKVMGGNLARLMNVAA